jgi:hypothetical protein
MKKLTSVLVAAAAALVVVQPATAHADSYVRHDALADVVILNDDDSQTKDPTRADGDIVTSGVSHYGRRLGLSMSFSELGTQQEAAQYVWFLRTNEGKRRTLVIFAEPGQGWWGAIVSNRGMVKCRGLSTRVDYVAKRVQAVVPRRCLSAPRWVQVQPAVGTMNESGPEEFMMWVDHANVNGYFSRGAWGPRVRRG